MITLFVSHGISDYEKWRAFFTMGLQQMSDDNGIQETKVYRTLDNSRVVGRHTFSTMEDAEKHVAMLNDPNGQAVALQNGCALPLITWVVEEIEF